MSMSNKNQTRRVRLEDDRMGTTTDPIGGVGGYVTVTLAGTMNGHGKSKQGTYPSNKVQFLD